MTSEQKCFFPKNSLLFSIQQMVSLNYAGKLHIKKEPEFKISQISEVHGGSLKLSQL